MMNPSTTSSSEKEKQPSSLNSNQPPPMMPYPGYPPPPPPPYHGYPAQPPYGGYPDPSYPLYPQQCMQSQHINHLYHEPRRGYSLSRVILCFITLLVIVATSISLFFWVIIFGTDVPKFAVESLDVPAFEIKNPTFNAIWEARLIVSNPNKRLTTSFENIEGRIMYNDILIDTSMVDPIFNLGLNDQRIISATFAVPSPDYNSTGAFWLQRLEEDRKKGNVSFSLSFVTLATFSSGSVWRRRTPLAIMCEDLQVQFPAESGGGKWNGSKQECFLTV